MDIDTHLDEVLGIIEKPQKEITKIEKVKPPINGHDEDSDFQYARENLYNFDESGGLHPYYPLLYILLIDLIK